MLTSSLLELLKTLSAEELKSFSSFVTSPFHNKKSSVTKFWNEIKKFAPDFDSPLLEKETLYRKLLPGKPYNYGTMKNLIYELSNLCEKFIELKIYASKPYEQKLNLAQGLMNRGLNTMFERTLKLLEKDIESEGEATYHGKKFLCLIILTNYLISTNKHMKTNELVEPINKHLTMGYLIDIFASNYNSVFMQNETGIRLPDGFIEQAIKYYERNIIEMDFRVKLYYNSFMLSYKEEQQYFDSLRKLLGENLNKISQEQKYNFCTALTNFCIKRSMEGQIDFNNSEYEVYKFMVDNKILSVNGVRNVDGAFYKNVAAAAMKAGESEWALKFIEKYRSHLAEEVRDNYYYRAMIEYYIHLKMFPEALKYLTRISNIHLVEKLIVRKWELMTYYELDMFEELRYRIDATRHFIINEKKLSHEKKEMLINLTAFVSRLLLKREAQNSSVNDLEYLKSEIQDSKCYCKEWLLEKADELKVSGN